MVSTVASSALRVKIENIGQIDDTYELGQQIGVGHFGTVHKARPRTGCAEIAVKTLLKKPPRVSNHIDYHLVYLRMEIEPMKEFDHQNVVRLLQVFEETNGA